MTMTATSEAGSARGPWEDVFLTAKHIMLGNLAEEGQQEKLKRALEMDPGKYRMVLELAAHAADLPDGWADMQAAALDDPLANMPTPPELEDEN